jgi:integrase
MPRKRKRSRDHDGLTQRRWKVNGIWRESWGYSIQVNGKQVKRFSADWLTKEDALQARAAALLQRDAPVVSIENVSLGRLRDEYLKIKEQDGKRSLKEDRRILNKHVVPTFGVDFLIRKLTAPMIEHYKVRRLGKVSPYTVANELTVLRHMLRKARRLGYLDTVPDVDMPKKPRWRDGFLTEPEITRLLDAAKESRNPYLWTMLVIALNTGMRKGELLGLEWQRINLAADFGLSPNITLYKTKSDKPRGIPVNNAVADALIGLQPDPSKRREGRVFAKRNGAAWGQVRTAFAMALKRAGLPATWRWHDLRHTAASHLVMRGATLAAVKEILGHSDIKTTMRYAHNSQAHLRTAVDRLDGLTPQTVPASTRIDTSGGRISHEHPIGVVNSSHCPVSPYAPVAQVDRAAVS